MESLMNPDGDPDSSELLKLLIKIEFLPSLVLSPVCGLQTLIDLDVLVTSVTIMFSKTLNNQYYVIIFTCTHKDIIKYGYTEN